MRKTVYFLMTATVIAVGMTSCVDLPQEKHTSFETMEIKTENVEVPFKYSATLVGQKEVTITPQTSGNVTDVLVQIGARVHRGQPLFRIDPRQAQAGVDNAEANVQAAKASMNTAKLEMESNKNLFDKGIVSSYMYETAKNAYNQAVAAVAQSEAALKHARLELSYCTVTAPVNGIVGQRLVELGELVTPGQPMATVSEASTIKAKFSASEDVLMQAKAEAKGMSMDEAIKKLPECQIELKDGSLYPHKGRLVRTAGVLNTQTGSIEMEAEFPNPEGMLTSGSIGKVVFPIQIDNVILIPSSAIVRQLDKTIVWMVGEDKCAHANPVEIYDLGHQVGITSGLKPGDKIVAKGATNVTEGQQVIFDEVKSEKTDK